MSELPASGGKSCKDLPPLPAAACSARRTVKCISPLPRSVRKWPSKMEPRRLLPALALVAGLLACASSPAAAQVETYCESIITSPRILGCIECLNSTKHCYSW